MTAGTSNTYMIIKDKETLTLFCMMYLIYSTNVKIYIWTVSV